MALRLTVLGDAQRPLASGPAVTLTLAAGRVYYINDSDSAGATGGYDLTLAKAGNTGGGGKRGFLKAPRLAGDALHLDNTDDRGGHDLSPARPVLGGPQPPGSAPLFMEELERSAEAYPARPRA